MYKVSGSVIGAPRIRSGFHLHCSVSKRGRLKSDCGRKSMPYLALFHPRTITGGIGEMSESISHAWSIDWTSDVALLSAGDSSAVREITGPVSTVWLVTLLCLCVGFLCYFSVTLSLYVGSRAVESLLSGVYEPCFSIVHLTLHMVRDRKKEAIAGHAGPVSLNALISLVYRVYKNHAGSTYVHRTAPPREKKISSPES